MKCLRRNRRRFYYTPYLGREDLLDDFGRPTGQYRVLRGEPVMCRGNISVEKVPVSTNQFGESIDYDKVIVIDDPNTPIDEGCMIWDVMPWGRAHLTWEALYKAPWLWNRFIPVKAGGDDTFSRAWEYEVKRVSRSLNSVSIAIKRVNVRGT